METDATERWIDEAVRRIVLAIRPEKVILFGSYGRGTQTRKSDIDLFVIWETDLGPLDRMGCVLELLRDSPRPVEPVVYTPAETERNRSAPFVRRILSEGRVLYDRAA